MQWWLDIKFQKITKTRILVSLTASLSASLTTVARLEAKQSSARPPFYATITKSPVGVPFGVATSVGPLRLVLSFIFNQAACLLHPTKPYLDIFIYFIYLICQNDRVAPKGIACTRVLP